MLRTIAGALAGVIGWIVAVTLLNLAPRHGWPAYAAVEKTLAFSVAMMALRLAMSGAASLAAGALAARIGGRAAAIASGIVLLALFVPQHVRIWRLLPAWYHLTFLASLPLLAWLGAGAVRRR